MSYLGFLSVYQFNDIAKNSVNKVQQLQQANIYHNHQNFQLGRQQPFQFDYPYMNNLKNLYGDPKYNTRGLIGVPYTTPFVIRPPNLYIKNDNNAVLDGLRYRQVEVAGYMYNINDIPINKPRKIS